MQRLLAALLTLTSLPAVGQVVNPDFTTDTNGWSPFLDAGGGGSVGWDGTIGYPLPGSALAGNVFPGAHVDGWRQCVPFSAGDFALSAAVASSLASGNSCRIKLDFIALPDCVNGTPVELEAIAVNTRNDGTFETVGSAGALPAGIQAVALSLEHVHDKDAIAGDSTCHFDHILLDADTVFADDFE